MKTLISTTALALMLLVSFRPATAQDADIVDTAVGAGIFNTLVAAVGAADLVDVLKGDGPFTVMAPTDDAFAALPEGLIPALLLEENKAVLTAILTYHVIPGSFLAADVVTLDVAPTVNGAEIDITVSDDGVMANQANVTQTDVAATNGVIHIIDAVILPPGLELPDFATAVEDVSWGSIKQDIQR